MTFLGLNPGRPGLPKSKACQSTCHVPSQHFSRSLRARHRERISSPYTSRRGPSVWPGSQPRARQSCGHTRPSATAPPTCDAESDSALFHSDRSGPCSGVTPAQESCASALAPIAASLTFCSESWLLRPSLTGVRLARKWHASCDQRSIHRHRWWRLKHSLMLLSSHDGGRIAAQICCSKRNHHCSCHRNRTDCHSTTRGDARRRRGSIACEGCRRLGSRLRGRRRP